MNTVNTAHNGYVLANLFMLAQPFGQPTLLSSYSFSNSDQGAPNGGYGTCEGTGGANGWICQHRWIAFAGMVGFHNQVGTSPVTHQVTSGQNRVAFGRGKCTFQLSFATRSSCTYSRAPILVGSAGFFAMNNEDGADWVQTFTTSLPDGVYCDVVGGSLSNGQCTGYYTCVPFIPVHPVVRLTFGGLQIHCLWRQIQGHRSSPWRHRHPHWCEALLSYLLIRTPLRRTTSRFTTWLLFMDIDVDWADMYLITNYWTLFLRFTRGNFSCTHLRPK